MIRKILLGMLFVFMFFCTGCATIMSHGPQTMTIISEPEGADLEIFDVRAGVAIVKTKTPHTATLERGDGFFLKKYYDIKLTKQGYMPEKQTITPELSGWYFANLLIGGGIGAIIIDPATGCMWTYYDKEVRFKMYPDTIGGHAAKLMDEKAKAEADAKAQQEKLAQAGNPIQSAFAETPQNKPGKTQPDNSAETTKKMPPEAQQDIQVANSQAVAEKTQPDTSGETTKNISLAKADTSIPSLDYTDTLIKGKTTKQDVEKDLGKPIEEERSMSGEYLYCAYLCKKTSPDNPLGTTHKLILKFDNKEVLNDYRTKVVQ